MLALLVAVTLSGAQACAETGANALGEAVARVQAFDLAGAVEPLREPAVSGCDDIEVAAVYLGGLSAAIEAYKQGGSEESLVAAVAAAQSEREEMGAFLTHAIAMESLQFAAGQPGAPVISAHEVAGELWLQVHRFDDARAAFERAVEQVGTTPRITAGLARASAR